MKEKEIIEGTANAVANHLPKTTSAIDNVFSSIVNVFDVLFTPFQMAKIYKDSKLDAFQTNLEKKISQIPEDDLKDKITRLSEFTSRSENGIRGDEDITDYYLKGQFGSIPTPDLFASLEEAVSDE